MALGVVFGFALVRNVLSEDATPRPHGAYYVFELIWRGGIYGAMDALLLTVLPCLVVYRDSAGASPAGGGGSPISPPRSHWS